MYCRPEPVDVVQDDAGWHVRVRGVVVSTHCSEHEAVGRAAEETQNNPSEEHGKRSETTVPQKHVDRL
jgi:hypothetical protein